MSNGIRFFSMILIPTASFAQAVPVALIPEPATQATAPIMEAPASASTLAIEAVKIAPAPIGTGILPANTDVLLRLDEEVNSKRVKTGHKFRLSVIQDVMIGSYVVIPRGTPATGEVGYRTGKGAFGKSAKMEIDIRSLQLNGTSVPMVGHYRQEGEGNTGATVGAVVAVGIFAAFVTGRSAVFAQGREFRASTRDPLPITFPN